MKKAMLKVLSLAMALTLVASLAACGGNSEEETTTGADTSTEAVVTPDETVAGEEVPSEDASAAEETTVIVTDAEGHTSVVTQAPAKPGDKTTQAPAKPGDNNKPTQAPAEKTSLNGQEALDVFNKATVGKSKAGKRYTAVNIVKLPGGLDKLKGMIQGMLPSANDATPISKPENAALTMADVSSATAKKNGNNWDITINVKPGAASNAHAFCELPKAEIDSWLNKLSVKPVDGVKFNYKAGTITATVTPDGNLVKAEYVMNVTVDVQNVKAAGIFSVSEAKVEVSQKDVF